MRFKDWLNKEAFHPQGPVEGLHNDLQRWENKAGLDIELILRDTSYRNEMTLCIKNSEHLSEKKMLTLSGILRKWGFTLGHASGRPDNEVCHTIFHATAASEPYRNLVRRHNAVRPTNPNHWDDPTRARQTWFRDQATKRGLANKWVDSDNDTLIAQNFKERIGNFHQYNRDFIRDLPQKQQEMFNSLWTAAWREKTVGDRQYKLASILADWLDDEGFSDKAEDLRAAIRSPGPNNPYSTYNY